MSGINNNNNSNDKDTDHAAMQRAFQEYMLGAGNVTTTTSPKSSSRAKTVTPTTSTNNSKRVRGMIQAFDKTLIVDWIEVDDNLHRVVQAIAHMRDRCWKISQRIQLQEQQQSTQTTQRRGGGRRHELWTGKGLRRMPCCQQHHGTNSSCCMMMLTMDDLQLALSHDLKEHERLLSGLRRLLAVLSQGQELLGQRLDEIYQFIDATNLILGVDDENNEDDDTESTLSMTNLPKQKMETCQKLYVATAQELYRKQRLAQEILNGVKDDLLVPSSLDDVYENCDASTTMDDHQKSSRKQALQFAHEWVRTSPKSHLFELASVIEEAQKNAIL